MESSPKSSSGQAASHLFIILVTLAQFIFFTFFHEYIAWPVTGADGSVTRLSMLTDEYFTWLPIMITGSVIVIITSIVMIVHDNYRFRRSAEIGFNIIGIVISVSLVSIYPFDFGVLPNATAVDVVPIVVIVFFILLPVFYAVTSVFMFVKLRRYIAKQETG